MRFEPTDEQSAAIDTDGSVLVSAAAGSGKTAVLVERVIRLLRDKDKPVSADRMLVVTFTNQAAAELRHRIEKRLNEELDADPYNNRLQEQKILLYNAKIGTIDSFCIDFLRENYQTSGVNPSFKIVDSSVLNELKRQSASKLFEEYFEKGDRAFLELLEYSGANFDDGPLRGFVTDLFEYSRNMPFSRKWVESIGQDYTEHADGKSEKWLGYILELTMPYVDEGLSYIRRATALLAEDPVAYGKYGENYLSIERLLEDLRDLHQAGDWEGVFERCKNQGLVTAKKIKEEEKTDIFLRSLIFRDLAKKQVAQIKKSVYTDKAGFREQTRRVAPMMNKLVELVCRYEDILYDALRERDLMTFYMVEQQTLSMLAEWKDGKILPREDADPFLHNFDAVLVDEYQDTNDLQDCMFGILSHGEDALFSVGDVKQSIYRFRGAKPLNFQHKREKYKSVSVASRTAIDLGCNFRSRAEICEYINSVFGYLMTKQTADVEYGDAERLVPMAKYEDNGVSKVESHLIDLSAPAFAEILKNDEEEMRAEARVIAGIIRKTINEKPFLRTDGGFRPATYGDITILMRSLREDSVILAEELKNEGIPVSIAAGELLRTDEAILLISFFKVINNPSDDIALLHLMTSSLFAFTIEELAQIRSGRKRGRFISAVSSAAGAGNDKANRFLKTVSAFRRKSILLSVADLMEEIFETTDLLSMLARTENGESKKANLLSLQSLASDFEEDRRKGVKAFLKHLENISNADLPVQSKADADSVTIMTIHKSKGLQFPVCILCNTSKWFNFMDFTDQMLIDEKFGCSLRYFDIALRDKVDPFLRSYMIAYEKRQLRAEELRLMYVAMTRAEEKLIVTARYDDLSQVIENRLSKRQFDASDEQINYSSFTSMTSYSQWILESLLSQPLVSELTDAQTNASFHFKDQDVYLYKEPIPAGRPVSAIAQAVDEEAVKSLCELYEYRYPFDGLLQIAAKASVTDIVHKADAQKYQFTARPAFLLENGSTASEKGTAVHKFMQHCDFRAAQASVDREIDRLYENGFITGVESKMIAHSDIATFFSSDLFKRIIAAQTVKREMKFLTEFPATELNPQLDSQFADEMIVVQGAVDLLFVEENALVIVDYKTDRNRNKQELLDAYCEQLRIYAKACSSIYGLPIKELILYSFGIGEEIHFH